MKIFSEDNQTQAFWKMSLPNQNEDGIKKQGTKRHHHHPPTTATTFPKLTKTHTASVSVGPRGEEAGGGVCDGQTEGLPRSTAAAIVTVEVVRKSVNNNLRHAGRKKTKR